MGTAPSPVPLPLEFGLGLSSLPPNPLLKVRLANLSGSVPPFSPNSPSITTTTMYFAATFVASLLLSANALVTPHAGDNLYRRHQHAGLARRAIAPEHPAQPMEASAAIPKRQLKKRCKPRRTSSGTLSATSSAAPLPSGKPANVAAPVPSPTTNHDTPSSSSPSPSPKPSPSPSSSPAPAPKPSPTSSAAPAPSSGSSGGQSSSLFTGQQDGAQGTFYAPGLGACGITNSGGDFIAAVSEDLFDHYPLVLCQSYMQTFHHLFM